jgi:uncharacterized zinc-type alcohol dehydrogenase-like protein
LSSTPALQAPGKGEKFEPVTIERRELRDDDILIDIQFAGICHSDIHQVDGDWGAGIFPMVPGHEIVGTVAELGNAVSGFEVGETVGVGCFVDSCGECEYCEQGEEQFCTRGVVATYNSRDYDGEPTYGGYSRQIVVKDHFVVHVPDGLEPDVAAPLLCAGITTYSPLKRWGAGEGRKVAVVGMGGLGHVGVQIAHAMGAEVTVLSQTLDKEEDGRRLGADHYYATSDKQTFKELQGSFDLILNTVSANLDVDRYLSLLRVGGAMVNVGAPSQPDTFGVFSLIGGRRSIAGSNVGGLPETQEMLDFCAEHQVKPMIELIEAGQVDEAYERVQRSDVRFRFVIDAATIG